MKVTSKNWSEPRSVLQVRRGDDVKFDKIQREIPYHAICDYAGREAQIAGFGEFIVGQKRPDISIVWNYFINPARVKQTSTGTGLASIDTSRLKLAVVGGAGSIAVESNRGIIYRTGHDAFALFTCAFDTKKAGVTQKAGVWDALNGFYLSMENDGQLAVNHLNGGVPTTILQTDFNLDNLTGNASECSKFAINPQALLVYRIMYGYLGQFPAYFEVYAGFELGWLPFHTIDIVNVNNQLILQDPYLSIKFEAASDGTNDVIMYSGSWLGGIIGEKREKNLNDHFAFDASKTLVAGTETVVGSMRVKSTFQGKPNKIPVNFSTLTGSTDGTKAVILKMYRNTPLTASVWTDPIGPTSVVEIDLVGTLTGTSPSEVQYSTVLGKVDSLGPGKEFADEELMLYTGDTYTFTALSVNASEVILGGAWDEWK